MKLGTFVLILMMFLTATLFAGDETKKADSTVKVEAIKVDSTISAEKQELKDKVIAYYFHGNRRCKSCIAIENYSHVAIDSGFVKELETGVVEFQVINRDEEENKHFNKDYELYTSSLVIAKIENGKQAEWKNLEKVWTLKGDKEEFIKYVKTEINNYLKAE